MSVQTINKKLCLSRAMQSISWGENPSSVVFECNLSSFLLPPSLVVVGGGIYFAFSWVQIIVCTPNTKYYLFFSLPFGMVQTIKFS